MGSAYAGVSRKQKYLLFPGIHVKVVNSYAAASLFVLVNFANRLDFPTLGNPINATRASPDLATAKPSPGPLDVLPPSGFRSSLRSLQSLAFRRPKCELVALFFCVIFISCSISLIFSRIPMLKLEFIEKITQKQCWTDWKIMERIEIWFMIHGEFLVVFTENQAKFDF